MIRGQKAKTKIITKGPYPVVIRQLTRAKTFYHGRIICFGCGKTIKVGELYGAGRIYNFCLNCIED